MATPPTVVATVAATSPLTVTFRGDADNRATPARNTSGLTLAAGNSVRVRVLSGGQLPEIVGRAS